MSNVRRSKRIHRRTNKPPGRRYVVAFRETQGGHKQLNFLGWIKKYELKDYLRELPRHGLEGFVDYDHEVDQLDLTRHIQAGKALIQYKGSGKLWVVLDE